MMYQPILVVTMLLAAPAQAGSITDTIDDVGETCRVLKEHIGTTTGALHRYRALHDHAAQISKKAGVPEVVPISIVEGYRNTYALLANITTSYKNLGCDKY